MASKCPGCGKDSEDGARFCNSCGATINGSASAASGPSTEPITDVPAVTPPPRKKSKAWLWVSLAVVGGLIVLVLLFTIAFFAQPEKPEQNGACLDNLRTIDSAIMQYAAATGGVYPNGTSDLLGTYVRAPFPTCKWSKPAGEYTYSGAGTSSMRAVCPNGHTY